MIRIGVAGWDYKDWWGIVYPAVKPRGFDPLTYLSGYFNVIEINSTFYRPPSAKSAAGWAGRVEHNPDFRFTAKLYQRFTHHRDEAWTRAEVEQVVEGMKPLQDAGRLGCVLIQFPWSFRRDAASREWLGDLVEAFGEFPLAVEVRHASWNVPEFYASLTERGVGAVNIDQPIFDNSITPDARATADVGYVRLHGRNYENWFRDDAESHERYDYLYSKDELGGWLDKIHGVAKTAHETYVVTNNHWKGQAAVNAKMLEAMMAPEAPVRVPGELRAAFGTVLADVGL